MTVADAADPTRDPFLKGSKLAKLCAGRQRPHRVFRLEHGSLASTDLAVRTLTAEETDAAYAATTKRLTERGGWTRDDFLNDAGESTFQLELKVQYIARAMVDPEDPSKPFAANADEVRRQMEPDDINAVFDELTAFQLERSPLRRAKTWAEVEEVADSLGKGLILPTALQRYDNTSLRLTITALVDALRKRTKLNSSDASPPNGSPDDSSPTTEAG